jgi:DNA-binding GntR family transcriptional regulator
MTELPEISRLSLHDQVAIRLRTLLIEGRIAPGAKLNERELTELLQVSRTPLREAIKLIAAEGLVDLLPNRGAVAVKLTEADILNTFEVLAALEAMSGELAAQRITDAELAEIQAMHFEMLASFTRRDLSNYYRLNSAIHAAINQAAKNPVLTRTYQSINARVQSLRFRTNLNEAKWQHAMHEHELMVQALGARDGAAMRKVLVQHLVNKRTAVVEQLRAGELQVQRAPA